LPIGVKPSKQPINKIAATQAQEQIDVSKMFSFKYEEESIGERYSF